VTPEGETKQLKRSLTVTPTAQGLTVRWGAKYAYIAEVGAGEHYIEGNPLLSFFWQGRRVAFRHVHHPGYQGWHYKERLRDAMLAIMRTMVENAVLMAARGK